MDRNRPKRIGVLVEGARGRDSPIFAGSEAQGPFQWRTGRETFGVNEVLVLRVRRELFAELCPGSGGELRIDDRVKLVVGRRGGEGPKD